MIDSSVRGCDSKRPFTVGKATSEEPYIHVLDELTLEVVLRELDTISDLVEYLECKEKLLTHPAQTVMAAGEEQLVARYMTRLDREGNHSFDVPQDATRVYIDEGHWEAFIRNSQYRAKKEADKVSYAWDRLIEHLSARGAVGLGADATRDLPIMERGLRVLASERRLARRQFASQLLEAMSKKVPPGSRFLRVGYLKEKSAAAYVFLVLPRPPFINTDEQYRDARRNMLLACCKVARLRATAAHRIVGIATEPRGTRGATEDVVVLEVQGEAWGPEQEEEARTLQKDLEILLDGRAVAYDRQDNEYPDVPAPRSPTVSPSLSPAERLLERARLRRLAGATKRS